MGLFSLETWIYASQNCNTSCYVIRLLFHTIMVASNNYVTTLSLLTYVAVTLSVFYSSGVVQAFQATPALTRTSTAKGYRILFERRNADIIQLQLSKVGDAESDDDSSADDKSSTPNEVPTPSPLPPQQIMKMDPLLQSVTRMDEETMSADRMEIPIWGELIMDKSLFVLLPIAAFAVVGFALSIYVLVNSTDDFVGILKQQPMTPVAPVDPNVCRGLCSSQQQDLEGLRSFMNNFGK